MPTPSDPIQPHQPRSLPSCPPELEIEQSPAGVVGTRDDDTAEAAIRDAPVIEEYPIASKAHLAIPEEDGSTTDASASRSSTIEPETRTDDQYSYSMSTDLGFALTRENAMTYSDLSGLRSYKRPSYPSSLLRPGSRFVGTQTDRQVYNVEVRIQNVDMRQSTICGYLTIDGLTPDFPSLTTFFDGEIVGPHYSFITQHEDWGATLKSDLKHWERFPAFRPLAKQARSKEFYPQNISQKENIFMRWKEQFLVPDHKVSEITGASYEGFYYICFNQIQGTIHGTYYHQKSDRYQSLELKHVNDFGRLAALEFA